MLTLWSAVINSVTKNFIGFLDELGFFKQKKSATLIFTLWSVNNMGVLLYFDKIQNSLLVDYCPAQNEKL